MTGLFVAVVGPSGAGKDTLIGLARERLDKDRRILFVRRTVTRTEGGNEDHDCVDPATFAGLRQRGAFVLSWGAHGLYYGIPATARDAVGDGQIAVANLSRGALTDARAAFPAVRIVNVTAPAQVLAARLANRGRESGAEIERRLARAAPFAVSGPDVVTIDNSGALEAAVAALATLLERLADEAAADQYSPAGKNRR